MGVRKKLLVQGGMGSCIQKQEIPEFKIVHGVIDLAGKDLRSFPDLSSVPRDRLEVLQDLNMQSNKLTTIPPFEMQKMPGLVKLDLSHNQLVTIPDLHFLQFLEEMDLQHNKITQFPAYVKDMPSLRKLNLCDNEIEVLPPEIGQCRSLRVLDISGNNIVALPLELAHVHLDRGGLEWTSNPLTFPPAEVRQLGQHGMMDWLLQQADIVHPEVRAKKQAQAKIREQETQRWLAGTKTCEWNTQEEYEEQLLRKPTWMDMDTAMDILFKERTGGGWWPESGYKPPADTASAAPAGIVVQGMSMSTAMA